VAGLQDARQAGGRQHGEREGVDARHWIGNHVPSPILKHTTIKLKSGWVADNTMRRQEGKGLTTARQLGGG
jgi:hypothetical protein